MMFGLLRRMRRQRTATVHVGTDYGGWLIPSQFIEPGSICYCAGAGEDISFDVHLAERLGAEVWIIDPTPRAVLHFENLQASVRAGVPFGVNSGTTSPYEISLEGLSRLHYLPVGLWKDTGTVKFFSPRNEAHVSHSIVNLQETASGFDAGTQRLSEVMTELGHDRIDLLKLDIEGAEIVVLDTMLDDGLDVRVICVEYDEAAQRRDKVSMEKTEASIERVRKAGYALVDLDRKFNVLFVRQDIAEKLGLRETRGSV